VFIYSPNNRVGAVEEFESELKVPDADLPLGARMLRRSSRAFLHHCPVPFSTTNILHNGDLLMCVHDWSRKEIIGNLRDASIAELWNGPRMRELRTLIAARRYEESPACHSCSLWKEGWV
ncbi:MAG TPA: SPASM domain-containing protein, partial [Gemmatimonadales bacterium]|nr:SPASM domain-containing protein [Gemmatimonadales bacterium]